MKKGLTQMVFVLDMSGSMSPLTMETIGGYNAMIADQKKRRGRCSCYDRSFRSQI